MYWQERSIVTCDLDRGKEYLRKKKNIIGFFVLSIIFTTPTVSDYQHQ